MPTPVEKFVLMKDLFIIMLSAGRTLLDDRVSVYLNFVVSRNFVSRNLSYIEF